MFFKTIRFLGVVVLALTVCAFAGAQSITINGSVNNNNPAAGGQVELTLSMTGTGNPQFNGFEATISKVGGGDLGPFISAVLLNTSRVTGIPDEVINDGITDVRGFKSGQNYVISLAPSAAQTVTSTPITLMVRLTMAAGVTFPFSIDLGNLAFGVDGDNPGVTRNITGFPITFGGGVTDTPTFTPTPTPTTPVVITNTPTNSPTPTPTIPSVGAGVFVLDDYGAVHTGGSANQVALTGGPYFGFPAARGLELVFGVPPTVAGVGVLLVDSFGAVHSYSSDRPVQNFYFWPDLGEIGADFAVFQSATSKANGVEGPTNIGFFVVDRTGKLWAAGTANPAVATAGSITPALNGNTVRAVDITLADNTGASGWILDNMGKAYPFGGAADPNFAVSTQDNWVDLEVVNGQQVRMDGNGVLTWSGTPDDNLTLPMVDGGLAIDLEVEPGKGLIMIDRYGALYVSGTAEKPAAGQGPPYFGFAAARDMEVAPPLGANVNNPALPGKGE